MELRHFRLYWRNGQSRDEWGSSIVMILLVLDKAELLAGYERFEELWRTEQ